MGCRLTFEERNLFMRQKTMSNNASSKLKLLRVFGYSAVLLIVLTMITLTSCSTPGEPVPVKISGFIFDSISSRPIDSAWVTIDHSESIKYFTNDSGFYDVLVFEGRTPLLSAGKEGYITKERKLSAVRSNISNLDFYLVPE